MDHSLSFTLGFLVGFLSARPLSILTYTLWLIYKHHGVANAQAAMAKSLAPKERP